MTVDPTSTPTGGTGPSPADVAALLTGARFASVRLFGQGYDSGEVDDYLGRLARELGKPAHDRDRELLGGVPEVRFTPRISGPRYAMGDVDDFLDETVAPSVSALVESGDGAADGI
jgi:DivIVA domain-containing protein